MKSLWICVLLAGCSLAPDGMSIGGGHSWNNYDSIGWDDESKFISEDGGSTDSVYLTFHWSFGPGRPQPKEDWDAMDRVLTTAVERFALAMSANKKTDSITVNTTTPIIYGPQTEEEAKAATTMGILEWYANAGLVVQIVIGALILGILITLIAYRQQMVSIIKLFKKKEK